MSSTGYNYCFKGLMLNVEQKLLVGIIVAFALMVVTCLQSYGSISQFYLSMRMFTEMSADFYSTPDFNQTTTDGNLSNNILSGKKAVNNRWNLAAILNQRSRLGDIVPASIRHRHQNLNMSECPPLNMSTFGPVPVLFKKPTWSELFSSHGELELGGLWSPANCTTNHKVAIVIPYRDRDDHLRTFLNHMHSFLQLQQLDYGIYVINENGADPFNRGLLMNIGFIEAMRDAPYRCVVFHDVDLLPEDSRNFYGCHEQPRHLCPAVDSLDYILRYKQLFGGVESFTKEHYEFINGFSNLFTGWGGEDDDLYNRMVGRGLNLTRPSMVIGRYRMMKHIKQAPNPKRHERLSSGHKRFESDGLTDFRRDSYKVMKVERLPTHLMIHVKITS